MNLIFAPAVVLMNRLGYNRKFILLGLMFLVAIMLLAAALFVELDRHIRTSQRELEGLELIHPISQAVQLMQRHRGLSAGLLGNVPWMQEHFAEKDREADDTIRAADARLPSELRALAGWQDIMQRWQRLHDEGRGWTVGKNFDMHTQLIRQVLNFESDIAERYELSLDPEFDSYYLIDTIVDKLPDALEHFGQIRAHGTAILALKRISEQQKLELFSIMAMMRDALAALKNNLERSGHYNPALREATTAAAEEISSSAMSIADLVQSDIIAEDYFRMSTAAIDSSYSKMYEILLPTTVSLLNKRIAEAKAVLYIAIGISLLLFLGMSYLAVGIARSVVGSVQSLVRSAHAFVDGDLGERVRLYTRDELKQVGDSFNEMADGFNVQLKARREAENALSRSNADLTRFAEVSAHHLMEPVRRLSVYSQRLRARMDALPQCVDDEVRAALITIERDAAHLRTLVRDIQLYLAASEPRAEVKVEDANAVLATLRGRLATRLLQTGTALDIAPLPSAMLDRPRLADLFSVLLDNALQHGRPADPAVPQRIAVSGERDDAVSRYAVSDNGPGVPMQYLGRVFEIFERLTPSGGESGSGIGLSIARRIVESRGGKIWMENTSPSGTRVVFELPDGE